MRLSDYLSRVGLTPPLPPTLDSLRRLHIAHLGSFIFDNLDIQRGATVHSDIDSVERKFLDGKAGGYCFEQNTLFGAVLRELGFDVTTILGRVGSPERRALNHLVLRVEIDGQAWLADVGFGGEGILEPLLIADGTREVQGGLAYSLRREGHHWLLSMHCGEMSEQMYEFGDAPHTPGDIEIANYYTSTHPASVFRRTLTIQRATPEERLILRTTMLTRYRDGVRTDTPVEPSQLRTLARELFGVTLDDEPLLFEQYEASVAKTE